MTTGSKIRPVTEALCRALALDTWPSNAACIDFGIRTEQHLGALQYALVNGEVSPEQLDEALGKGESLQALISPRNPYRNVAFRTAWDDLDVEPEEF